MFQTFFISELKYSLKRPMIYIFFALYALLSFAATASDNINFGGAAGTVFKNAPHVITALTTILTFFGLLIAVTFYNNAALRDYNNNFNEILFSTPLSKPGYFFGRFFAALLLATIPLLGIFIGILLSSIIAPLFGWTDASRYGPFYITTFVNNYFLFILPNMFFAGTIIFALANKWKSTMISFAGSLLIIIAYMIAKNLTSDIDNETIGALTDTFGTKAYQLSSKYFTPLEKNTLSPSFTGLLLLNRVIWISSGIAILLLSYFSFSFQEKNKKIKVSEKKEKEVQKTNVLPTMIPSTNSSTGWSQFKSFFVINFLSITKSVTFKILFLFCVVLIISNLYSGYEYYGLQSYPLTYKITDTISKLSGLFVIIVLVFFSGELVWRDRETKINEVIDVTPHTAVISLVAKVLSLISTTIVIHSFLVLCGISYQLLMGFTRIELDLYFLDFVFGTLPHYVIWSSLLVLIQVIINKKYLGYFISILLLFLLDMLFSAFDLESNMLLIGGSPSIMYSDLNEFGPGFVGNLWFKSYWILFSLICLLVAGFLWNRGVGNSLKNRILIAKKQVPKSYRLSISILTLSWVLVAGFVYYNTQILNEYQTADDSEMYKADYEKTYKKYENVVSPKINDVKYHIDIFPNKRDVHVKAEITLINDSETKIDSIHYMINGDWETEINIPNSKIVLDDSIFNYEIHQLATPLMPGDKMNVEIRTKYISKGFENRTGNTSIVKNGTFLNNLEILPKMGYQAANELGDKDTRKKHGLAPKDRMPELETHCSHKCMKNYLSKGTSDFIDVETIISTSSDQIAIAPGSIVKKWKENDRNYYHYKVDHPSQNFYSFMSANYKVKTRKSQGIELEVYYDSKHSQNIDIMLDAMERSLKYYIANFGPYMHKQCRIIEFPRYGTSAQAFPGTMPYSESYGFVINLEDKTQNNIIDAVIAHEIAHQWWGHQLVGANIQGSTMFSESFAEYSSLMTLKGIAETPMKMRGFLKYNHNDYLRGRSGESIKELPLYKVEGQHYIHYKKGSIVLYALQDYIGEERVNTAMKNFLDEFKYSKPPYPTSHDFMRHLEPQVPDSLKYVINDWFKTITLYDNRLKEATYQKLDNGKYEINMIIESNKLVVDSLGIETKITMNDWVDVGVFSDEEEENLIFEKRIKIDKPEITYTMVVDSLPYKLAIDPRHLLIDRVYDDNIKVATESEKD